jgi:hypothetical protein
MASEIATQQTSLSAKILYATLDGAGLRWNGSAFVAVSSASWTTYAVALAEAAGTGYFAANLPAGIAAGSALAVTVFRQIGASPAPTDPVVGSGSIGGVALTASGLDAIAVESGVNARQALSPILAAASGAITGNGTTSVLAKSPGTGITRITATMSGADRTATTLNLPI